MAVPGACGQYESLPWGDVLGPILPALTAGWHRLLSGSGLTLLQLCSRTGLPQPARVWPGDGAERQPTMWAGCLEAQFSPSSTGMAPVAPEGC